MQASAPDDRGLKMHELGRRLEGFALGSSLAMFPTLASIAVLLIVHGADAPLGVLVAWAAAIALVVTSRILITKAILPLAQDYAILRRQWRRVNLVLMVGSLTWAASLPLAAWLAPAPGAAAISIVGAALLSGVLLMHRTTKTAALFHILALSAGLAIAEWLLLGWQAWPLLALLVVYATTLTGAILYQDRQFRAVVRIELERRASEQTVRMLLNDHESQAADWLWAIDGSGGLVNVSDRLAEVLHAAPADLAGEPFLELIEPGPHRERLAQLLAAGEVFRDEPAAVQIAGERRFWRLSGQPLPDGGMTGVGRDVSEQLQIEERIRAMAYVDPLTELANRHLFNQRLREALHAEGGEGAALVYLDLDDFKAVNDAHGHGVGDALLRELAARLRRVASEQDTVARLGGDEFAILILSPPRPGILIERAHRLLATVREPFQIDGQALRVSTSIGIAHADRSCDAAELMRRVDLALYAAKAKGRDQLALFDETLDRRARERRALGLELREALAREELILHYQPVIALKSGATVAYEALVRWRHPTRGLLQPDQFLPIAEETGLIVALGDWVIGRALAEVADWGGDFRLAVNLSPSQCRNPLLMATIERGLTASGFAPQRLEFEITEHVLLQDGAAGAAMLERLRALGAQLALDDFGTGYSSLSYLRRFRFDRIKIDRSFVRDIEASEEAQAIVAATTMLAQALGIKTTAEGVERAGQLAMLRKLGCDEAQGFHILEPVDAKTIEATRAQRARPPSDDTTPPKLRAAASGRSRSRARRD